MLINSFKISKGHNLSLGSNPELKIVETEIPSSIVINPCTIKGIKTKLLVKENDYVGVGTPLFFDKKNPEALFVSTCSGKILKIVFGPRRSVESIIIENDNTFKTDKLDFSINRKSLLKSGLWTYFRKKPFSRIPNSDENPNSIFISALSTQPYGADFEFLFNNSSNFIQNGIDVLKEIFNCDINFTSSENSSLKKITDVTHYSFNNLHPAGNIGVQIHHIKPIKNSLDSRWYLSLQDLSRIGHFFTNKEYPIFKYITVGGNGFTNPSYMKQLIGTSISTLVHNQLDGNVKILSGDVLSGRETNTKYSLDYYDEILSIIKIYEKRDFLGWLMPGSKKYSISNTFISKLFNNRLSILDTRLNGSVRSIIPMGNWDKVLPMNILSEFLVKSILVKDIDMMEKLGIYECSPEDFALCSFVCQSKVEVSSIINDGLTLMEEEL